MFEEILNKEMLTLIGGLIIVYFIYAITLKKNGKHNHLIYIGCNVEIKKNFINHINDKDLSQHCQYIFIQHE